MSCKNAHDAPAHALAPFACAHARVLLYELGSKHVREVPKAVLEGKSAQCCAFLLLGGKVRGVVRMWLVGLLP
eukprot:scaffold291857_cov17-Tisochrysis_lutea.AAC.1